MGDGWEEEEEGREGGPGGCCWARAFEAAAFAAARDDWEACFFRRDGGADVGSGAFGSSPCSAFVFRATNLA